jgi:hypothetical protein
MCTNGQAVQGLPPSCSQPRSVDILGSTHSKLVSYSRKHAADRASQLQPAVRSRQLSNVPDTPPASSAADAEPPTFLIVRSEAELLDGLNSNTTHIELQSHMKLEAQVVLSSSTKTVRVRCQAPHMQNHVPATCDGLCSIVQGQIQCGWLTCEAWAGAPGTEHPCNGNRVQGNCGEPNFSLEEWGFTTGSIPFRSLKQRQCVVVTETAMFLVEAQRVWLDRLYLRVKQTYSASTAVFQMGYSLSNVWMTDVTVQGAGPSSASTCTGCGLVAKNSSVYAEGEW